MRKFVKAAAVAVAIALIGSVQVFASTYKIGTVNIGFSESSEEPGVVREAEPYVRTSGCEIADWSCSHDYSEWRPGSKITFNLEIVPVDDKHFSTTDTKVNVSGDNAEISSTKVKTSKINVKVNYWPTIKLGTPENLVWDDDDEYVAVWDKVPYADAYEVKILVETDEDKSSTKTVTVTKPKIDLSSYATTGDVSFKVRAVPKNDKQKKYYVASDWIDMDDYVTPSTDNTISGDFKEGRSGDKIFIENAGGQATGWQKLNGNWYYFNPEDGNTATTNRWANINEKWFHFDTNSVMESGWIKPDATTGFWYYLNNDLSSPDFGMMQTGWMCKGPAGPWYWLNDGSMQEIPFGACLMNGTTPDGYIVDENGAWYGNN